MIAQETVYAIKNKMDVVDVLKSYLQLKKQGVNYVALCPFHNEKSPSFTVSPEKQIYKCFGCGVSGDAIEFIMQHEKKSYVEAITILAKKYNVELKEEKSRKAFEKPIPRLEKLGQESLKWFEQSRKISNDTLLRLKITEAVEWMPLHEKNVKVICFNYYENEELVNIKYRGPKFKDKEGKEKKSFKLSKDSKLIFYNIDALRGEEEAVIAEGEIDLASWIECGIYNSVGVPNGTPPAGSKMSLEYLDNGWQKFSKIKKIILATDNDGPGLALREELARRFGKERCWQVSYPKGCKDTNDVLVKLGRQAVIDMYASATRWPLEGIISMDEMYDTVVDFFTKGYPEGSKAGIGFGNDHGRNFDDYISFVPGQLTTFTGIPGSDKDEFVNLLETRLAIMHQWPWGIIQFEESNEIKVTKLMEKIADKSFAFRKDQEQRMNKREFEYALAMVDKYFHFVKVHEVDVSVEGLIAKIDEMVLRYGIKAVEINPWNWLEHRRDRGISETEYVSESLTKIISCLERNGVHGFLVAHPTKIKKDEKTGKYKVATLYDISGSAHFFNKTHNGVSVYRDFESGLVDVYIQKIKHSWLGKIGFCSFTYDTFTRKYSQVA